MGRIGSQRWSTPVAAAGACLVAATLAAACGSSAAKTTTAKRAGAVHRGAPAGPCRPGARNAFARLLHVAPASVTVAAGIGNTADPTCTYATRVRTGKRVSLTADVYSGPQPYFVLERTIVEAAQPFTPTRLSPAPQTVTGLGLEASWFPNRDQLMSTDGLKLITVTVAWPGAEARREIAVAKALSLPYLKKLTPKQAIAVMNGYPCDCG
jgi:hypothetical protein